MQSTTVSDELTQYLIRIGEGDAEASRLAFPYIYTELQRVARSVRFQFHGVDTLNTTAIIHEAYLKLSNTDNRWQSSSHFYCVAAKAMRQVLLNAARAKNSDKRGGEVQHTSLDGLHDLITLSPETSEKLIDFEDLLQQLEQQDILYGRIVECRFFAGMSIDDTAEALQVSPATVKRKWQLARNWLYIHLS
jgi:RNA polymerase sigma factor (TIGR02999 family)